LREILDKHISIKFTMYNSRTGPTTFGIIGRKFPEKKVMTSTSDMNSDKPNKDYELAARKQSNK